MRSLWTCALLVCIAALSASSVRAATGATGPTSSCPNVLLIESTNGKYYVAVFESHAPTRATLDLTLFTQDAAYNISVPDVEISKPISTQNYTYRSAPTVIRDPADDEFLGAAVTPHAGIGCAGENVIIPSVTSLTSPERHVDPEKDALEAQLATEASTTTTIFTPVAATGITVPNCTDAFDDATVDRLVKPVLSDAQRRDAGLLPVVVRAELDAAGAVTSVTVESSSGNAAVDAAAAEAARKTTYHPARFACQAERSSHTTRVDFSK